MSWASVFAARMRGIFGHKRLDRELDDEVRFHLDMRIEDNLRAGMRPVEADMPHRGASPVQIRSGKYTVNKGRSLGWKLPRAT